MVARVMIAFNLFCLGHAAVQEASLVADSKSCLNDEQCDADAFGLLQARVETSATIHGHQQEATEPRPVSENEPLGLIDEQKLMTMANQSGLKDFTLLIGDETGTMFNLSSGRAIPANVPIPIFSASKWVAAAALGGAVQRGKFSWDDKVNKYISFWPTDAGDARSEVTFRSCLSLTSGLVMSAAFAEAMGVNITAMRSNGQNVDLIGLFNTSSSLEESVKHIMALSSKTNDEPGTFRYGESHFMLAAYAAMQATGESTWKDFVQKYWAEPLKISAADFDYKVPGGPDAPNTNNPDPGAELQIAADTYAKFLTAYVKDGDNLFGANELDKEQSAKCAKFCISPPTDTYALGHWVHASTPRLVHSLGYGGCYPAVTTINGKKFWFYINRLAPGESYPSVVFAAALLPELVSYFATS